MICVVMVLFENTLAFRWMSTGSVSNEGEKLLVLSVFSIGKERIPHSRCDCTDEIYRESCHRQFTCPFLTLLLQLLEIA